MKLAVDPTMIRHLPVQEVLRAVGEIGYEYVELSPRLDVLPPSRGRRVSLEATARIAAASRETGVGVASLFVVYPWASPEEGQRAAAVRYLEQACEVAVELGCERLNTELTGDPRRPLESEAAFWRSVEDVVPGARAARSHAGRRATSLRLHRGRRPGGRPHPRRPQRPAPLPLLRAAHVHDGRRDERDDRVLRRRARARARGRHLPAWPDDRQSAGGLAHPPASRRGPGRGRLAGVLRRAPRRSGSTT